MEWLTHKHQTITASSILHLLFAFIEQLSPASHSCFSLLSQSRLYFESLQQLARLLVSRYSDVIIFTSYTSLSAQLSIFFHYGFHVLTS